MLSIILQLLWKRENYLNISYSRSILVTSCGMFYNTLASNQSRIKCTKYPRTVHRHKLVVRQSICENGTLEINVNKLGSNAFSESSNYYPRI